MRIGFDIDNTLADLTRSFTLAAREYGYDVPLLSATQGRDYCLRDTGLEPEDFEMIWAIVKTNPDWWMAMPFMLTAQEKQLLQEVGRHPDHELLYITHRSALGRAQAADLTLQWLIVNGLATRADQVFATHSKGRTLRLLRVDAYLDDAPMDAIEAVLAGVRSFMLDRPYNRINVEAAGVRRVSSVAQYLQELGV